MRRRQFLLVIFAVIAVSVGASGAFRPDTPKQPQGPFSLGTQSVRQHQGHTPNNTGPSRLSVAVEGAATPEAISDDLAYQHLLLALASPAPREQARNAALFRKMGLNVADQSAFGAALSILRRDLDAIARNTTPQPVEQARAIKSQAVQSARAQLNARLSATGRDGLDDYIQHHVKRRIVIFRGN